MKKYTFIMAFTAIVALTACGSGSTATETKDSTSTLVDSASVGSATTDSTAKIPADTSVVK